jgi:hypothetical protein
MATAKHEHWQTATSAIAKRVTELRGLAERDQPAAREFAWAWLARLGRLADREPTAVKDLAELFACGQPSRGIDGLMEGMAVVSHWNPVVDALVRHALRLHNAWVGKRFDAELNTGVNVFTGAVRWPLKLIWPSSITGVDVDGNLVAFQFQTRVEPGVIEPRVDVLVIDYAPIEANPPLAHRVRDELVEIVPGVHLGRGLLQRGGNYRNVGYFALRDQRRGETR